jgi:hypothetical protein
MNQLCTCGCNEIVTDQHAYVLYDSDPFVDIFHVIQLLKDQELLEEVG